MASFPSGEMRVRLGPNDLVGEHADLLDLRFHAVPRFEEVAGGRAYSVRRAGGDDVAGEQGHGEGEDLDALVDGEDHLACVARLPHLPVHAHHDVEALRVGQFVGRHQHGAHGAEGVEGFALEPLGVPLLQVARGDVVDDGVAEDVLEGVGAADVVSARPDDRGQFHLVVELARHRVVHHVVAGADHRRAWLGEVHGMLGNGGSPLRRVIGVVAAEAEDVAGGVGDRGEEANPLERIGEFAPGQLLDGLLDRKSVAVLPRFSGEGEGRLAALDHLEEAPGKACASAPHRAALDGQILGETAKIEHGLVPHGAGLGFTATATEGDEAHGYWLTGAPLRGGSVLPVWRAMSSSSLGRPKRTSSSTTCTSRTSAWRSRWSASTTSVTRNSGVEAPAVTPTRLVPSSHSARMSFLSLIR